MKNAIFLSFILLQTLAISCLAVKDKKPIITKQASETLIRALQTQSGLTIPPDAVLKVHNQDFERQPGREEWIFFCAQCQLNFSGLNITHPLLDYDLPEGLEDTIKHYLSVKDLGTVKGGSTIAWKNNQAIFRADTLNTEKGNYLYIVKSPVPLGPSDKNANGIPPTVRHD